MADVKQCDRCKQFYNFPRLTEQYEEWVGLIVYKNCNPHYDSHHIDLCDDCKKKLLKWLKCEEN